MSGKAVSGMIVTLLVISMSAPMSVLGQETHDVAVTSVEPFKTMCSYTYHPFNIVYENYSVYINATVENQGDFDETFNVTAKYDGNTIQTMVDVNLIAHTSTNVTFTWDTTGVPKGNYTVTVEAEVVAGETETGDNNYTDDWVVVTWLGDRDGDFDLDADDLWYLCGAFIDYYKEGFSTEMMLFDYDEDCDIDIDEGDLWVFCEAYIEYYKS